MSLMKLLTVSRSFVVGQSQLGRYRMVGRHGGLPQFGFTDRPVHPAAAHTPARSLSACQNELPRLMPNDGQTPLPPAPPTRATAPKPVKSPFTRQDSFRAKAGHGPAERRGFAREAISRLRGWFRARPKRRGNSPFIGKAHRSPVQAHLVLESVQVVRNDLSDSDFEVRPVGAARAAGGFERPSLEKLKHGLAGMSWHQVTARLFEASRARIQTR